MKNDDPTFSEIITEKIFSWIISNENPTREIAIVGGIVSWLSKPTRYPSACVLQPSVKRAERLVKISSRFFKLFISAEKYLNLQAIAKFCRDPHQARDIAIEQFIEDELQKMGSFFDGIESNPLTPEQRLAVVTDEDATLVLAAAGSGKTSVIVAKAAYLIEREICKPEEILLISYARDAKKEMSARLKKCLKEHGDGINTHTFHSLGNKIIAEVDGDVSALAAHADDDKAYRILIRGIIMELAEKNDEVMELLIEWFGNFFCPHKSEFDFETMDEYNKYIKENELRTLNGELVKSFEELTIANWLYKNQIAYKYEPDYKPVLPASGRRRYTPDFRLTKSDVYIEHFGIRKEVSPDGEPYWTPAPYIDRDKYIEGIKWKREVHAENKTTLIETYSEHRIQGRLTEVLEKKIRPYATPDPLPPEIILQKLSEKNKKNKIDKFTILLGTFLKHFKGAGLTIAFCRARNKELKLGARGEVFLKIFEFVYDEYQARLGQRIDFEDMIVIATDYIKSGAYQSPFSRILVDEFQDISKGRAELLNALKVQRGETRIFAVGDDWQSIYRFAGSDVYLMKNFSVEFGGHFAGKDEVHKIIDLGRTFRSVERIAQPARDFILKNPAQLKKKVKTLPSPDIPSIFVRWTENDDGEKEFNDFLKEMNTQAMDAPVKPVSILLLGRYRKDNPANLKVLNSKYPNLSIDSKTIHRAKGLEADHVIILRANSGFLGFPNTITDDEILDLVLPTLEQLPHAEERRVFYVALTRARKSVTILSSQNNSSSFVDELVQNPDYGVVEIGGIDMFDATCPDCGERMVEFSENGAFWGCANFPICPGTRAATNSSAS